MEIKVMDKILAANDAWAKEVRNFLRYKNIIMFNLIGSPGAGKTRLLEKTAERISSRTRMGVIEGDIATTKDAERIKAAGVPVVQINTGSACHLDAHLIFSALKDLTAEHDLQIVFVENIGNLVCPAEFDIGEQAKIAVLSVTEGDDKIEKYPLLFTEARALVITKLSLLKHADFNLTYISKTFKKMNPQAPIITLDSKTEDGFENWLSFIADFIERKNTEES